MRTFAQKRVNKYVPFMLSNIHKVENVANTVVENNKKIEENKNVMTTQEKILAMSETVTEKPVMKIKRDKGLIERAESSKTILTEDNKELLKD